MSGAFLADVPLGPAWRRAGGSNRGVLLRRLADGVLVTIGVRRSFDGWLRDAYPASSDDIELYIVEHTAPQPLTAALAELSQSILNAERQYRRVVFAASAGDRAVVSAAQAAGFRYVLDVDVPGAELSLLVAEPDWLTTSDTLLDEVPGS